MILLEYGSDINITYKDNHTPLEFVTREDLNIRDNMLNPNSRILCAHVLIRHVIKMKAANFYVHSQNLQITNHHDETDNFHDECQKEIVNMKAEHFINSKITFYNILTNGDNALAKYMKNEDIARVLKSDEYKTKFPIYATSIIINFRKGMKRKELFDRAREISHIIFNNFFKSLHDCAEETFSYLSNKDLRIFIDAFSVSNRNNINFA